MKNNFSLSVVSPVYQAEKIVDELVRQINASVSLLTNQYEIILVEDGSPDNSWSKVVENCEKYSFVKGVKLSRNFGQHYAISAGIDLADSDYVVVMDCDLQDNPKYISQLLEKANEGNDIVYTYKEKRNHSMIKNLFASGFNFIFNFLMDNNGLHSNSSIGSYSLLSRKVVLAFRKVTEYQRHYLMILRWLGFSSGYIKIEHQERFEGRSSYTFSKLINHAIQGITSQTDKLLRINIYVGFAIAFSSMIAGAFIVISYLVNGFQSGWASLIITLFLSLGIILVSIGIVGLYIGKIFEQVKNRPMYIFEEKINF